MADDLGTRMKEQYEDRTRFFIPRRTYTLMRIDGKAFHTYTRGCAKPFDAGLMDDMDKTATALCEDIQGAVFAYVQSDEISISAHGLQRDQHLRVVRRQRAEDGFHQRLYRHGSFQQSTR
jgi:tRNA(His) 5'-end guanylyltransferase